jgi:hypothetical protein
MRRVQLLILFAAIALGCVDRVDLSLPAAELPLIIEGMVTDNPGAPDTIRLSQAYAADGKYHGRKGIPGATFWITDASGGVDYLTSRGNGIYVTDQLQGSIGETYTLHGILPGGTTIISSPQRMLPAGDIDSMYYEFASTVNPDTGIREEGLNVFINTSVDPSSSHRMRWKFNGTYVFISDPSLIVTPMPLPCATNCTCCKCWASEREDLPLVASPAFETGSHIDKVFVKYIPVNGLTFYQKYRAEVTQMELSEDVFEFYSDMRKQMENAGSLFQPPFFALKGNVSATGNTSVIGVFAAAGETTMERYIHRSEVSFKGATVLAGDCRAVIDHSNNVAPPFWD